MLGVIVAILVSAAAIKGGDQSGGTDEFVANAGWLYVAIVAAAYMISRGLAKGRLERSLHRGSRRPLVGRSTLSDSTRAIPGWPAVGSPPSPESPHLERA